METNFKCLICGKKLLNCSLEHLMTNGHLCDNCSREKLIKDKFIEKEYKFNKSSKYPHIKDSINAKIFKFDYCKNCGKKLDDIKRILEPDQKFNFFCEKCSKNIIIYKIPKDIPNIFEKDKK